MAKYKTSVGGVVVLVKHRRTCGTSSINQSRYNDVDWSFYDAINFWS